MLELWRMRNNPWLPSLPGPLWPGVGAPDRVLSMGQIELNCTYAKPNCLKKNFWHLNVNKRLLIELLMIHCNTGYSEFSFWASCLNKAKEISLPYYLRLDWRKIVGFISFPKVRVLCEMQPVSSRIWTRVGDSHYAMNTSIYTYVWRKALLAIMYLYWAAFFIIIERSNLLI